MADEAKYSVDAEDLRRLWHWVMNSNHHQSSDIPLLRAALMALGKILQPLKSASGHPTLPVPLPVTGAVPCAFDRAARIGMAIALSQAVTGENHPANQQAPFGSLEFMILPLARALSIEDVLVDMTPILGGGKGASSR